jgi:hypothetical protein
MLKPGGGRLHLFDVVFPAEMPDYECRFNAWLESMKNRIGLDFAEEGGQHTSGMNTGPTTGL